jgi:hypothetical protein
MSRGHDYIDIGVALERSNIVSLGGVPFPVQFRNQGALDAWTQALGHTDVWERWTHAQTTCWDIRQEILWQLNHMDPLPDVADNAVAKVKKNRQMLAIEISANLKYYLNKGTVIEATPELETLLTNSDVDLSLPMSMVAPPYAAQYLRFGEVAQQFLKVPISPEHRFFDGVFCFFTPPSARRATGETSWALELLFTCKRKGCYGGHVTLLGETDRGEATVGSWLERVLSSFAHLSSDDFHRPMHAAVSYVVKVFLYMALKQARTVERRDYDQALRRASGLGDRKRVKLLQKAVSLYNGILVGPAPVAADSVSNSGVNGVAPHWRRGHFRMQPHGPGKQERKLIFVAPILIHADQLRGEIPAPKPYRARSAVTPSPTGSCGKQRQPV